MPGLHAASAAGAAAVFVQHSVGPCVRYGDGAHRSLMPPQSSDAGESCQHHVLVRPLDDPHQLVCEKCGAVVEDTVLADGWPDRPTGSTPAKLLQSGRCVLPEKAHREQYHSRKM